MLSALCSVLPYMFVGLTLCRFVFIACFLIRDLELLAASKFWLLRDEVRTVFSVGSGFFALKVPFFPFFLVVLTTTLSSDLGLLRIAALPVDAFGVLLFIGSRRLGLDSEIVLFFACLIFSCFLAFKVM